MLHDTNKMLQEYNVGESSIVVPFFSLESIVVPYMPNSFKLDMNCVAFI
jgi:hypothetical protein